MHTILNSQQQKHVPSDFLCVLQFLKEELNNQVQSKTSFFSSSSRCIASCLLQLLQHGTLQQLQRVLLAFISSDGKQTANIQGFNFQLGT